MKTAIQIQKDFYKEIENLFIKIDENELEKIKEQLANCEDFEVNELRTKQQLLEIYLYKKRYF